MGGYLTISPRKYSINLDLVGIPESEERLKVKAGGLARYGATV